MKRLFSRDQKMYNEIGFSVELIILYKSIYAACIIFIIVLPKFGIAQDTSLPIFTEQFPPYSFVENGQVTGINIQFLQEVCEHAGIDCSFTLLPWKRAMRKTSVTMPSGLVSTARTNTRENLFKWVGPLSSGTNCVYRLASANNIVITDKYSLKNYKLGVSNDSVYMGLLHTLGFKENVNMFAYPGKFGLLKPFAFKRIDLLIGSANSIHQQLSHVDLTVQDIVPVFILRSESSVGNYLAMHPNTPEDLVARLQHGVNTLKESRRLDEIEHQFLKLTEAKNPHRIDLELWNTCVKEPA